MTERTGSGGGMTGATGDLTPDQNPEELVTGERREIEDPTAQAAVTQAQAHDAPAQAGSSGSPGSTADDEGPTELGDDQTEGAVATLVRRALAADSEVSFEAMKWSRLGKAPSDVTAHRADVERRNAEISYREAIRRDCASTAMNGTRRRSQLLRYAMTASCRLQRLSDPAL